MNRTFLTREPVFCFTADVDWVSDPVVEYTQLIFQRSGIIPTYFATHPSPCLDELVKTGRAECGIHPNFLEKSSHGKTFTEVCGYFDSFHQDYKKCFRSHRYFDVTDINILLKDRGFEFDSNLFTFLEKIPPYVHFSGLTRFPCCWEDGTHLRNDLSLKLDRLRSFIDAPGLTVMSVHPLHMAINSPDFAYSRSLKDRISNAEMLGFSRTSIENTRHDGPGIATFFESVLRYIQEKNYAVLTLNELYQKISRNI